MTYVYWFLGLWAYIAVCGMCIDEKEVFPDRVGSCSIQDHPSSWPGTMVCAWLMIIFALVDGPRRLFISMWRHRPQISLRKRDED